MRGIKTPEEKYLPLMSKRSRRDNITILTDQV